MCTTSLPLDPNRFTAYKKSTADQSQRDAVHGLTFQEAHANANYPFGKQSDSVGAYCWCACLTECYKCNSK